MARRSEQCCSATRTYTGTKDLHTYQVSTVTWIESVKSESGRIAVCRAEERSYPSTTPPRAETTGTAR